MYAIEQIELLWGTSVEMQHRNKGIFYSLFGHKGHTPYRGKQIKNIMYLFGIFGGGAAVGWTILASDPVRTGGADAGRGFKSFIDKKTHY